MEVPILEMQTTRKSMDSLEDGKAKSFSATPLNDCNTLVVHQILCEEGSVLE